MWRLVELAEILGCKVTTLVSEGSDAPLDQLATLNAVLEGLTPDDRDHVIAIAIQAAAHLRRRPGSERKRG